MVKYFYVYIELPDFDRSLVYSPEFVSSRGELHEDYQKGYPLFIQIKAADGDDRIRVQEVYPDEVKNENVICGIGG